MNPSDSHTDFPEWMALHTALEKTSDLLGSERVQWFDGLGLGAKARRNVGLFRSRELRAIVKPRNTEDVQKLMYIFSRSQTAVGLHAVSTGRNWGLGSAESVADGTVMLDLSDLNGIRALDCDAGWAVIEPGVTQLDLVQALSGSGRMLNVTASSGHTSVIGNALERGVGLRRQRTEDLLGLEVLLPDGTLIRTGWWPAREDQAAFNPHGLGPSLLHLFTQSNLGIVTAAVVHLLPKPQAQCVLTMTFAPAMLLHAVDALRTWVAQELVSGVLKIYDAASATSYGSAPGEHLALVCVSGHPLRVSALSAIVCDLALACGCFSSVHRSDEHPAAADDVVLRVVEHAHAGSVDHNERMLAAATGVGADQVDSLGGGWLFFLVLVPFDGRRLTQALEIAQQIGKECGVRIGTTVNALSADVIDLVVSLKFAPMPNATRQAHAALDLLYQRFFAAGLHPYRLDIDHAHWCSRFAGDSFALGLSRRLKEWLDPHAVIAAGRYA